MKTPDADVARFRAILGRKLGLQIDEDRTASVAELLRSRAPADQVDAYLARLETANSAAEVRSLAQDLTVGETYFFRHLEQFRALREVALPARVQAQKSRRALRILSAGCASGDEAYSIAIVLREQLPDPGSWDIDLWGIDVNPAMIEKAVRGRYSAWSLRETPVETRHRYFCVDGRDFCLEDAVRTTVSFEERNLVEDAPSFWQPEAFDIVFCRNVIMYFTPEVRSAVIARLARSLCAGGFLFLGHAETLRGISQAFHLCHTHGTFYYRRRDALQEPVVPSHAIGPKLGPNQEHASPGLLLGDGASWVEVIQNASERIARMAEESRRLSGPPDPTPAAPTVDRTEVDLEPTVELLRQERFLEAMSLLHALPTASRLDPEAQLLRAVLLTNAGQLAEAEQVCRQVLAADDLNAGAHYLMALCREHGGDRVAAAEHARIATYLDAGFAMPHLQLGLLARRAGDVERARDELSRAISLLGHEDPSRILLFGGGFTREALIDLCRSELRACRGRA
ncbi:MAG: CheR family methyltransferase [Polyangiaceae bacterium]|jgi:chemotaxis protein methyltransferase CheR